jgi:broad specificity phosphatase PhoE
MSRLLLVRHGQASAGSDDYDQLSERGYEQARTLGAQWAAEGVMPNSVYVGPRKRHRQTAETLAAQLPEGWPEPVFLDGWDEHNAFAVVMHSVPILAEADAWVAELSEEMHSGGPEALRAYLRLYRHVTRLWVREELEHDLDGFEPWRHFRERVERSIDRILAEEGRGKTVAVFTSSGPVSIGAGRALGLDDVAMMELSWMVQNISVTEILYSGDAFSLKSFNALPCLSDGELKTYV